MELLQYVILEQLTLEKLPEKLIFLLLQSGRANMITADMVKPGAVVIDVGMNRLEGNKVVGDVDYEGVC